MASPARAQARPVTPSTATDQSSSTSKTPAPPPSDLALRARLASMSYSFTQQMPHLPSRPRRPQDLNFPHLPTEAPAPRAWDSSTTKPAWPPQPAPKATAAEVVAGAAKTAEAKVEGPNHAVEERHQAELALYSKLVPTTSAVPRNPGRSLGGGGLRATGSVAAQKGRSVPAATPLVPPQPLSRPMASRMRNLSSDASKPQLARRVAKPSRTLSATPPPAASETAPASNFVPLALVEPLRMDVQSVEPARARNDVDRAIITPSPREVRAENEDAFLKSVRSIYGNVDKETIRPASRSEATGIAGGRESGEEPTPRPPTQPSRRLDEAFKSPSPPPTTRYEGKRSPSPVPSRKDQIGALRRSSALSPPPGLPAAPRKGSGRDGALTPVKNGRKSSMQDSPAGVPPGFEARTSTVSRGSFLGRNKPDSEGLSGSNNGEREREPAPARPQNARAHAFREAINTRRHSSSPRPASSRHTSGGDDPNCDLPQKSSGSRTSTGREGSRLRNGDKEISRPVSFPTKHSSSTLNGSLSPDGVRSRQRSENETASLKRDEKILQRRLERPAGLPARTLPSAESKLKTHTEVPSPNTNRTDSTTDGSIVGDRHVEKKINTQPNNGQLKSLTISKDEYIFAGTASDGPTEIQSPKVVSYSDRGPDELSIRKSELEARHMNGWSDGTNGVSDGNAEAFVNDLLEHEDDDYMPVASTPMSNRPVTTGPSQGPSMIDFMRQLHANAAVSSVLSNPERQEDVLPPLPNSEEDVRFETMLRSMGWTPPDEDETPKNHQINGTALPVGESSSRGLRVGVSDLGLRPGLRKVENGKMQSPYYSHFQ